MPDNYELQLTDVTQPIKDLPMIRVNGIDIFLTKPDMVRKTSPNEVVISYGEYDQYITAEGTGNTRSNFQSQIIKRS